MSIITIRGVLEDGSTRAAGVPATTSTSIRITAGETVTIRLYVTTPDNRPMKATGRTLRLTIRKAISDTYAKAIIVGAVDTAQGDGCWTFAIPSDVTRKLCAGSFLLDIWSESATDQQEPVVLTSNMFVAPSVRSAREALEG